MRLDQLTLNRRVLPWFLSLAIFLLFLGVWYGLTQKSSFDPSGMSEEELMTMEFNGDIIRNDEGEYIYNPEKARGIPGPTLVWEQLVYEVKHAFEKRGTNDHGIGHLIFYTIKRFLAGFLAASVFAILLGVVIGLYKPIFSALNPYIQLLKPISPLAWMPLFLYTVKDPVWTAILVVFMASLWPTVANTAFGVNGIRKDYVQIASLLEFSWLRRLFTVVLPAAAPTVIAGMRISLGSALVAVVPAEMLLGELGVGYLSWMHWNNLNIGGIIVAIIAIGFVGFTLDTAFSKLSKVVSYPEP